MPARKKILVVDDESVIRVFLRKVLAEEGYEVVCAGDGKIACRYVETDKFDLIILDLIMPRVDGIEALRRIRKIDADVSVIILSAYLSEENIARASEHGISDYVHKPFKLEELKRKIRRALASKKAAPTA